MPTLHYGLNLTKKEGHQAKKSDTTKRRTIFDEESDGEGEPNDDGLEGIDTFGDDASLSSFSHSEAHRARVVPSGKTSLVSQLGNLSSTHSATKHAASAQEVDPSVYDYDAVYDSLHAKPQKSSRMQGPKYMQNLLEAAEVRKRDQLRAKEKMLAKEREAEGDEFAHKEKFVTGAYKAQQEEVQRLEKEEKKTENDAMRRKQLGGNGMNGLYKGLLDREEARHEAIAKSLEEGSRLQAQVEKGQEKKDTEPAPGNGILLNDDGEIVDKRQLLKAGLNVSTKLRGKNEALARKIDRHSQSPSMAVLQGRVDPKTSMRERQTRMVEMQLEEAAKRVAEEDSIEQEALQRAAKSRKTEVEIKSARERYLERKRNAEVDKAAAVDK